MSDFSVAPVIGLEIHAQLLTRSKMFCSCSAAYAGAQPNAHVCAVCLGIPGALPVINARAVDMTVLTALSLNCEVPDSSKFDRKNYHYPDLPKGYQISQYDSPIGRTGWLEFEVQGRRVRCGITRVHLEEDTGKLTHTEEAGRDASLIDYNRSGVPLMEIVTEPELRSPADAREFFAALRRILMYLGVNDGNLQEGSMRADVNVSLQRNGSLGTKVEIKNLNSFRAVERALDFEIERQAGILRDGGRVVQETRGWVEQEGVTVSQRSKEYADDYRYFPEPDLPALRFTEADRDRIRAEMPELPLEREARFESQFSLSPETAALLAGDKELADYFEAAVAVRGAMPRTVANWLLNELAGRLRERHLTLSDSPVTPLRLGALAALLDTSEVAGAAAKEILDQMLNGGGEPAEIADRLGLRRMRDDDALEKVVREIIANNPEVVADYRKGKFRAADVLVGKAMAATGRRAEAQQVRDLVVRELEA